MRVEDRIYVGHRTATPKDRRFLRIALPLAVAAFLGTAATIASRQVNPDRGAVWETGHEIEVAGELVADPFPMLRISDPTVEGGVRRIMLVSMGKHGADAQVAPFLSSQRSPVAARGYRIERDGQRMLELAEGEAVVAGGVLPAESPRRTIGEVVLRGEIVDSKCWLGVMQPGEGKAHRDCATLCIRGGVPPSIVCRAPDGSWRRAVLVDEQGEPLRFERLAAWIAMPVEVRGVAETADGLAFVRVASIRAAS